MEEWKIRFAGAIVRAVAQNLREDVRGAKDFGAVREDLCAFGGIVGVGITGFDARAGFERDLESGFRQRGQHRGYQRNAPLPRKRFAGYTNNHDASSDAQELRLILVLIRILAGPHCNASELRGIRSIRDRTESTWKSRRRSRK